MGHGAGKALAVIGGLLCILVLVLGFVMPMLGAWYKMEASMLGMTVGVYWTPLGMLNVPPELASLLGAYSLMPMDYFWMIAGILSIVGGILALIGGAAGSKGAGVAGGVLALVGIIVFVMDLFIGLSPMTQGLGLSAQMFGGNVFFSSFDMMGVTMSMGVGIGFYLSTAGAVLALIGGATCS